MKASTRWKYLYRALDKDGNAIEYMLSAKRDTAAVKRFFRKMMRASGRDGSKGWRGLVVVIMVRDVPATTLEDFLSVAEDQGEILVAIQQGY